VLRGERKERENPTKEIRGISSLQVAFALFFLFF